MYTREMNAIYSKYNNLRIMLQKYRGCTLEDPIPKKNFPSVVQLYEYARIKGTDQKGQIVHVFLIRKGSQYARYTAAFTKLLRTVKDPACTIIFVTHMPFSSYIRKAADASSETIQIFNYMHKHFNSEIPLGPFCTRHIILTHTEVRNVILRDLKSHPLSLPKIYTTDAQAVWAGAMVGQIVKTVSESPLVGMTVKYRVVAPAIAKITTHAEKKKKVESVAPKNVNVDAIEDEYEEQEDEAAGIEED
jgi:DNA-directed RNA polymerase subunit H (RpoH/RPB5)